MIRSISAALVSLALLPSLNYAQDGPIRRVGRALDNTGKNIRDRVETEVARGQVTAEERDVLARVARRIEWDKRLLNSTIQIESRAGGTIVLRGSVVDAAAKARAVDLVENTVGVSTVVDELALMGQVKVIQATPAPRVIEVTPPVVVPSETRVIVKP